MSETNKARKDIIYADLSGHIIGVLLNVYNQLGHGHPERTYQKAVAVAFSKAGLKYVEQLYVPVLFEGKIIGKNYFDFLVEDKVVVEIKRGDYFMKSHIDQVNKYLISKNLKLGILAYFAPRTVHLKRVVNLGDPYIRN